MGESYGRILPPIQVRPHLPACGDRNITPQREIFANTTSEDVPAQSTSVSSPPAVVDHSFTSAQELLLALITYYLVVKG